MGKKLFFHQKEVPMKTYLTILFNVETKKVEGAFRTDLESINEDMETLRVKKLEDIKDPPNLSHLKSTHCATILYTNSTCWMWTLVNGRLRAIPVECN